MGLVLAVAFLITALLVALRRLFRGPRRPSWSWREETLFALLRWGARHWTRKGVERLQANLARVRTPRIGPLKQVSRERVVAAGVPAVWITPSSQEVSGLPVILYLHGGGYVACSTETHASLMARLALAAPARVLGINYRLAPVHPYPAALEDALAAHDWLVAQGIEPDRIIVAGDSAGGGLALATLVALRDRGQVLPAAGVLLSPWVDLEGDYPSMRSNAPFDYVGCGEFLRACGRAYLGERAPGDPLLTFDGLDLGGLPPLLIQVGALEVLHDQDQRLAERARAAGVEVTLEVWDEMVHVFQAFAALVPAGQQAIEAIGKFVRRMLADRDGGLEPASRRASYS